MCQIHGTLNFSGNNSGISFMFIIVIVSVCTILVKFLENSPRKSGSSHYNFRRLSCLVALVGYCKS
jgi:hypothetical protein